MHAIQKCLNIWVEKKNWIIFVSFFFKFIKSYLFIIVLFILLIYRADKEKYVISKEL